MPSTTLGGVVQLLLMQHFSDACFLLVFVMSLLQPGGAWEDKTQWLARMSKMLCTFCVIMVQPEQQPLSLADGWAWLANAINISSPRPGPDGASSGAAGAGE